ncbi:MAG: rhodanese-like domain-containing protein [Clostridioides sp.]|jgi:rhodanese-related sulfurtransferase|nr:rhodanese-like domain-containing protein [Clostridioides sp.]
MNKKLKTLSLGLILALTMGVLAGCGQKPAENESKTKEETSAEKDTKKEETEKTEATYKDITGDDAKKLFEDKKFDGRIIDVRPAEEYAAGHIVNAVNIPVDQLKDSLTSLEGFKDKDVIVYCNSGKKSTEAAKTLSENGFTKVSNADGVKKYTYDLVKYTDLDAAATEKLIADTKDLQIVDVRDASDFGKSHLENAKNIALADLESKLDGLSKDKPVLVYCNSGFKSAQGAKTLQEKGFKTVYNAVDGVTEHEYKLVK